MCPIANLMTDKICEIFEIRDGIPSSRVKGLVDGHIFVDTCDLDGSALVECVRLVLACSSRPTDCVATCSSPSGWPARSCCAPR